MVDTQVHTERNAKTVVSVVTVETDAPVSSILSRFVPSADVLNPAERQRLLDACAAECRTAFNGQAIDWQAVEATNAKIGEATTRSELVPLLALYKAAVIGGQPA